MDREHPKTPLSIYLHRMNSRAAVGVLSTLPMHAETASGRPIQWGVEVDVCWDGAALVATHDLPAGPNPLPLPEMLRLLSDTPCRMMLELKPSASEPAALQALLNEAISFDLDASRLMVTSFSPRILTQLRSDFPSHGWQLGLMTWGKPWSSWMGTLEWAARGIGLFGGRPKTNLATDVVLTPWQNIARGTHRAAASLVAGSVEDADSLAAIESVVSGVLTDHWQALVAAAN